MVEKIQYRWDFIGLSTDTKPTPETNDRVANGSTFYCSDNSKLYVWYKDQWYEKTVSGGGGGGTSNFNDLSNRPNYNGVAMTGDTNIPEVVTYSDFTGTDGTAAGTSGLVPAPATTDAGKFLKADGTWDTAGGGGGVTPVQTTGTSTTDVMSQDATTHMVYSEANPSTSAQGGAIYLGNLDANQVQQADPATANRGWKYFWALPSSNTSKPINNSVCILGDIPYQTTGVAIGSTVAFGCKVLGSGGVAIGPDAEATQNSVAIGFMANASRDNTNNSSVIAIGSSAEATADYSICIGGGGSSYGVQNSASTSSITLGYKSAISGYKNSVALGAYSSPTRQGEVNVGLVKDETTGGYNNTAYRVIGGVHDGQLAQDAVTVSQVNATIDAINTALSTNIPHIGVAS